MHPPEEEEPASFSPPDETHEPSSPLTAMKLAMQAATEAAQARLAAKARARREASAEDQEASEIIAATAARHTPFNDPEPDPEAPSPATTTYTLSAPENIDSLVAELERSLPDVPNDEVHGDLIIKRSEEKVRAWYDLAAENALPAPLRAAPGPIDVKRLLTALLVEVGDIKRTNAILMEHMTRIEEKLDRLNRSRRQQR